MAAFVAAMNLKYSSGTFEIKKSSYASDGSTALGIFDEHGTPELTATVSLACYGEVPAEGNVFIKNWSENEGVLDELIRLKVVSEPIRAVPAGFATAYECKLLADL